MGLGPLIDKACLRHPKKSYCQDGTIHSSVFPMQQTEDIFLPEGPQILWMLLFPVLISCQAGENVF